VFAVLFAWVLLGERLPASFAAGAALIVAAVLTTELGDRREPLRGAQERP